MSMDGLHRARGGKSTVWPGRPLADWPVANLKKVAWAIAHHDGSVFGFTMTEAARKREVGRRSGLKGTTGYVGGSALGAGSLSSSVTPGLWSEGPQASLPRQRRRIYVLLLGRRGNGRSHVQCSGPEMLAGRSCWNMRRARARRGARRRHSQRNGPTDM